MNEYYDAIIVGTGAAGLYCALNLPKRKKILMLTKQGADLSDSFLAQGGICMLRGEDDYEDYFEDTMRAGHYENNKRAVNLMIRSSNDIIRDLLWRNVDFVRAEDGELAFTREGAHSRPRILFHEDITGKEITQTLLDQVKTKENIEICEYMTMSFHLFIKFDMLYLSKALQRYGFFYYLQIFLRKSRKKLHLRLYVLRFIVTLQLHINNVYDIFDTDSNFACRRAI